MCDDERPKRLLSDLSAALRKDLLIDEFGFVFCPEPVCNKSPVILEHHKLGIETWSIKILYPFVHQQLIKVKPITSDTRFLHDCSQAAVLLNPECTTAWNVRKQLVLKKVLSVESDLKLATLVLTKHPKSAETFSQRRWLLQHLLPNIEPNKQPNSSLNPQQVLAQPLNNSLGRLGGAVQGNLENMVAEEMKACTIAANRYPNNYNAWSHRIWVLQCMARGLLQVLKCEWSSSKDWVSSHISDHSGFHYRQFLMQCLKDNSFLVNSHRSERVIGLVEEELQFTANLISYYPGHEAIWYHRRYVIHFWRTNLTSNTKVACSNSSIEPLSHHDITVMEDSLEPSSTSSSWQSQVPEGAVRPLTCCSESSHMDVDTSVSMPMKPKVFHGAITGQCGKESCEDLEEELLTIITSEINFADAVKACTPQGDVEAQRRCADNYKRWLTGTKNE